MADWELLPLFNVASYVLHNVRQVDAARDAVRILDLVKVRGGARKGGEGWCVVSGVVNGVQHWLSTLALLDLHAQLSTHKSRHNTHRRRLVRWR